MKEFNYLSKNEALILNWWDFEQVEIENKRKKGVFVFHYKNGNGVIKFIKYNNLSLNKKIRLKK